MIGEEKQRKDEKEAEKAMLVNQRYPQRPRLISKLELEELPCVLRIVLCAYAQEEKL
ncbi:uncharacterized protein DS421_11g336280 [Arachis hypogaea]|nr:uncharacterized protein DS421_11g336280 [Arachis hypogaea]